MYDPSEYLDVNNESLNWVFVFMSFTTSVKYELGAYWYTALPSGPIVVDWLAIGLSLL